MPFFDDHKRLFKMLEYFYLPSLPWSFEIGFHLLHWMSGNPRRLLPHLMTKNQQQQQNLWSSYPWRNQPMKTAPRERTVKFWPQPCLASLVFLVSNQWKENAWNHVSSKEEFSHRQSWKTRVIFRCSSCCNRWQICTSMAKINLFIPLPHMTSSKSKVWRILDQASNIW